MNAFFNEVAAQLCCVMMIFDCSLTPTFGCIVVRVTIPCSKIDVRFCGGICKSNIVYLIFQAKCTERKRESTFPRPPYFRTEKQYS
jgi:hypothetical protein